MPRDAQASREATAARPRESDEAVRPKLTPAQVAALRDLEAGPLWRDRTGWGRGGGTARHRPSTIAALAARHCVDIDRWAGCMGKARLAFPGAHLLARWRRADAAELAAAGQAEETAHG